MTDDDTKTTATFSIEESNDAEKGRILSDNGNLEGHP